MTDTPDINHSVDEPEQSVPSSISDSQEASEEASAPVTTAVEQEVPIGTADTRAIPECGKLLADRIPISNRAKECSVFDLITVTSCVIIIIYICRHLMSFPIMCAFL